MLVSLPGNNTKRGAETHTNTDHIPSDCTLRQFQKKSCNPHHHRLNKHHIPNRVMRMSGRVMSCFAALFLALASVSAVERLNSINDLKKINFGQSVPKHTLLLLHWFANVVEMDSNNIIRLTFDPNNEDFGSHHYGNYEQVLDPLPRGYKYYTVGNLLPDKHEQLPGYVTHPRAEYVGRNRDRIVFSVRMQNRGRQLIDRVYITQHYGHHRNTTYNPDHTYEITTNLLRQIREFSVGGYSLSILRNRYGRNRKGSSNSSHTDSHRRFPNSSTLTKEDDDVRKGHEVLCSSALCTGLCVSCTKAPVSQ
ncbi:unnamed protein product [Pleuronectes platessa]|uniref:Uncharacterized protein n=1 Tax=Pleuronectes platessa TaxID=8262 RepID=A0A9N7VJM3_PLEPL|nr:unnamed protein product [Pleuronectes platessa]